MEQESRYNGIVDAEGMERGRRGHHCHRGRHDLWDDTCEDPRVLMYIDDKRCTRDATAAEVQDLDGPGRPHGEAMQSEAESAAPVQEWQQATADNAAQYQNWQQENAQNAAQYQGWQQANAEYAAQVQGGTGGSGCGQVRPGMQFHVHELQGTVEIAEAQTQPHNHRFTAVTSEARPLNNNNHYHDVRFRTDFYQDHFHEGWGRTGGAIQVGDRHVHFLESVTTQNDGHLHRYRVVTMIDNPTGG